MGGGQFIEPLRLALMDESGPTVGYFDRFGHTVVTALPL
jgi:hypothetical protein